MVPYVINTWTAAAGLDGWAVEKVNACGRYMNAEQEDKIKWRFRRLPKPHSGAL